MARSAAALGCAAALVLVACGGAEFTNGAPDATVSSDAAGADATSDAVSTDAGSGHDAGHDGGPAGSDGGKDDASPDRDSGTGADAAGDAARGDADTDADAGGGPCSGAFPSFDRSCDPLNGGSDCAIGDHRLDCCGTIRAFGIASAQVSNFNAAEALWDQACPECACPAGATEADDGTTGTTVTVTCATSLSTGSLCTTHAQ